MKKSKKASLALVLSVIMIFALSVNAFATDFLNGTSRAHTVGTRQYTVRNNIGYSSSRGVSAFTQISCDTKPAPGEMGVYPMLQNERYLIVLSPGWVYNTAGTFLSAGSGYYDATSGTYYSGGGGSGVDDTTGVHRSLQAYLSPGWTVSSTRAVPANAAYGINEEGQTYGTVTAATPEAFYPDLVGAVGLNGTEGYVLASELQQEKPKSSEEAVALMTDPEYIQGRIIDLYAADGKTIIGKFRTGGLIGVTVQEDGCTTTYMENGTIVTQYANGAEKIVRWK